ncbi:MAG: lysine 5,6-aminomutase subunit alpha TIM-barrel domain-containing protein, partial [Streptosporangiaceae bacterium]
MESRLRLDPAMVAEARELARVAGQPIVNLATRHTTVSVERAVLRLAGLEGADADGMPWVNRLAGSVRESTGLEHGVALPVWDALLAGGYPSLRALAADAAAGAVKFRLPEGAHAAAARDAARAALAQGFAVIDRRRAERDAIIKATADPAKPWIYLIVATGDIYEDIPQAQAA